MKTFHERLKNHNFKQNLHKYLFISYLSKQTYSCIKYLAVFKQTSGGRSSFGLFWQCIISKNRAVYLISSKFSSFIHLNLLTLESNIWQFLSRRLEVEVHLVCYDNAQPQIFEILSPSWTVYQIHPFQIGGLTCVQFAYQKNDILKVCTFILIERKLCCSKHYIMKTEYRNF